MASDEKWYFSKEQLDNTPSRHSGIDAQKELVYRQQAAYFIQDMGQRLRVSQLCINTASVYMHRFYVFHSFTQFPWSSIAAAALFLAAKVEEQPRKLEHVIRVHNICKNSRDVQFDVTSERYQQQSQDLVFNENILLQTLGFDVAIDHPHAHVVKCCQLVRASKDLGQTSYFMASTSLHLTTMCLQYKPTVVACFCIHLACKWSNWEIPLSNESREWFSYVDASVTSEMLAQLTDEFLTIFSRCPSRLKDKIMAVGDSANINRNLCQSATPPEVDRKPVLSSIACESTAKDTSHHRSHHHEKTNDEHKHRNTSSTSGGGAASINHQREKVHEQQAPSFYAKHQHKLQQQSAKTALQHRMSADVKPKTTHQRASWDASDKDAYATRSEKDEKRAHPLMKNSENSADVEKRSRAQQQLYKHDGGRSQQHMKNDLERSKATQPAWFDSYTKKTTNHTTHASSQQLKVSADTKSVPKVISIKQEPGSNGMIQAINGNYAALFNDCNDVKPIIGVEHTEKKPSMFSPEKTPPRKTSTSMGNMKNTNFNPLAASNIPSKAPSNNHMFDARNKKADGVESLSSVGSITSMIKSEPPELSLGDSFNSTFSTAFSNSFSSGNALSYHMPPPAANVKPSMKEHKSLDMLLASSQPIVNGIETNPTLISNLLKEAPSVPHLVTIVKPEPSLEEANALAMQKDKKKRNKEKHKHKDKDKSREEKEKKRKHKEKEKHRSKNREKEKGPTATASNDDSLSQPIKITISKEKIQPTDGLKIKIPKDKIKTEIIEQPSAIKIKIPKDVMHISGGGGECGLMSVKKRERASPPEAGPQAHKLSKYGSSRLNMGEKQNGRSAFAGIGKVGDDESMAMHYISKGMSSST